VLATLKELQLETLNILPHGLWRELHKSNNTTSTIGLQLINLCLLKEMLGCVNDGVTTIKPGHQTTGKARVIWSDESSFTLFPASGRVCVRRTPKEAYIPECPGSNIETR
jgi:hypothetical protein